jgi:DNA-nicking Smr family endonuclease
MKKPDFGDILEKWEHGINNSQRKVMDEWLQNNKIYNKDDNMEKPSIPGEKRRHLHQKKPDDILDIHGFTSEKAWLSLEHFFSNAKDLNYQKLRIIHGKGNHTKGVSTLGLTVRKYIEKCPFAGENGFEKAANGGSGATWVLLKKSD